MDICGAIFDMDGTLIDSMPVWDGVWERFLVQRGIPPEAGITSKYKALTLMGAAEYYRESYGFTDPPEKIAEEINDIVLRGYEEVVPKTGVRELLGRLRHEGVPMCVATNTARRLVEKVLKRLGLFEYFEFILPCEELGMSKSRPEIFFEAARRLGTPPDRTWVFEDAPHAIKTAHGAGFPVAAIFDSSYAADEGEIRDLAQVYVHSFDELHW